MGNIKWAKENLHNGSISIGRSILFIDAYTLLGHGSRDTILAKKALMLNLQLGVCSLIIFKIWDRVDFFTTFSCVPYQMFFKHFGKTIASNPLGLKVCYDLYDQPRCVWDKAKITTRDFGRNPIFLSNHLTERRAYLQHFFDIRGRDILREPYPQEDDDAFTLDWINLGGYNNAFKDMSPIAECTNWDMTPKCIYISKQ